MIPPILSNLKLPVIVSPMFLVSNLDLVIASCKAGIVGSFPSLNSRTSAQFKERLEAVEAALDSEKKAHPDATIAPFAVNLTVRLLGSERFIEDLEIIRQHKVPIVITSVGDPSEVVEAVHAYGGLVFHDVTTLRHAKKAAGAGVDGLILVCAGAGGHAGVMSPFAFVPQVRAFFDKTIILAGAISDGRSIRAAQALGADLVYMGTRFIATHESDASPAYKQMLVSEQTADLVYTPAFSGIAANYLRASIVKAGMDPDNLPAPKGLWQPDLPEGVKAWRDVWSAGQGIGMIKDIPTVGELTQSLIQEFQSV